MPKKLTFNQQYQWKKKHLSKSKLDKLASKLLEKEVIFRDDLEAVFGKRPFEKDGDASLISPDTKIGSNSLIAKFAACSEPNASTDSLNISSSITFGLSRNTDESKMSFEIILQKHLNV